MRAGADNKRQANLAVDADFHLYPMSAGKQLKQEKHKIDGPEELHQGNPANPHTITPLEIQNAADSRVTGPAITCSTESL